MNTFCGRFRQRVAYRFSVNKREVKPEKSLRLLNRQEQPFNLIMNRTANVCGSWASFCVNNLYVCNICYNRQTQGWVPPCAISYESCLFYWYLIVYLVLNCMFNWPVELLQLSCAKSNCKILQTFRNYIASETRRGNSDPVVGFSALNLSNPGLTHDYKFIQSIRHNSRPSSVGRSRKSSIFTAPYHGKDLCNI